MLEVGSQKSEEFNLKFNDFRPSLCRSSPYLKVEINDFKQTLNIRAVL